jgi:hypothetical protein
MSTGNRMSYNMTERRNITCPSKTSKIQSAQDRTSLRAGPTVSTEHDFYDDMRNFLEIIQDCPPPIFHKY